MGTCKRQYRKIPHVLHTVSPNGNTLQTEVPFHKDSDNSPVCSDIPSFISYSFERLCIQFCASCRFMYSPPESRCRTVLSSQQPLQLPLEHHIYLPPSPSPQLLPLAANNLFPVSKIVSFQNVMETLYKWNHAIF